MDVDENNITLKAVGWRSSFKAMQNVIWVVPLLVQIVPDTDMNVTPTKYSRSYTKLELDKAGGS